jgi:hypothetical protein
MFAPTRQAHDIRKRRGTLPKALKLTGAVIRGELDETND